MLYFKKLLCKSVSKFYESSLKSFVNLGRILSLAGNELDKSSF